MLHLLVVIGLLSYASFLLAYQVSIAVWTISYVLAFTFLMTWGQLGGVAAGVGLLLLSILLIFTIKPIRRRLVAKPIFLTLRKKIPPMSTTEREAIDAGTVSWEGDLLSGCPDFDKLIKLPVGKLTAEEQAFIDGPVVELCRQIDDWDITHTRYDLSPDLWEFIKRERFLGMIIPKEYGGLGFSASAQMTILCILYTRSITVATTVSVPNSLGPAELLLKYGTSAQKNYYLPRLADGREIPCFALTAPDAGSDAASIPDIGIICHQEINGQTVLGMKLTWNKRYITLCPVATVIGLAFRLFDPAHLLGQETDLGISCALIPADTPGVIKGRRHFPLGIPFMNGPTQGKDVFVPLDVLIGGPAMAGKGWQMLMECLSAGRAISLPSSACAGVQTAALACGAYARVRRQFHLPIGKFEGIEEPLARIGGNAYLVNAAINMTVAAIDQGAKPAVAGAILKYHTTERSRQVILDAMDIHGGKGICMGPSNYLARGYQSLPIGITVEGANILTRSLIIFGQGAVRCHPFVFQELESLRTNNIKNFDRAFFGHIGFALANFTKSLIFLVTDAAFTTTPVTSVPKYYQHLHRLSANLAFTADFCMGILGSDLKRKEKISARLGDVLSYLYLASAVLKQFHDEGEPVEDRPLVDWSCQHLFSLCDLAFHGVINNFPYRWGYHFLKLLLQPWGIQRRPPLDSLGAHVAKLLTSPNEARNKLVARVFKEPLENCPLGRLEEAFHKIHAAEALEHKVLQAAKQGLLKTLAFVEQIQEAGLLNLLNSQEIEQLLAAEQARQEVIAVDDFNKTLHK